MNRLKDRNIVLIIGGGIAAYKSLDLIRRLKERGATVSVIMTSAAQEFITPLAAGAVSHGPVLTDLFDRQIEADIGHIRLAREADLILIAPATADLMAKMAHGLANDLATAVLLATTAPVLIAPAMNPAMWSHVATMRNAKQLAKDGIQFIGPEAGEMAEAGEAGIGRMAEPLAIANAAHDALAPRDQPLAGRRAIVTAGPTHEPIDPVRYLANRSSGKQGYAIAGALAAAGATVTLVSGPTDLASPDGVIRITIETARDMAFQVEAALPVDIAVMAAAVADWRPEAEFGEKQKKSAGGPPALSLVENPDILKMVASHKNRPDLVIGFAAETENLLANAETKLVAKGCDWIIANDVSPRTGIMGGDRNQVHVISKDGIEDWPDLTKVQVADRLVARIVDALNAGLSHTGANK
ncbi:MAG: bifunctional phosphopantothenoylcysteine decarboxylase/phosphopantothenate--cysteine ligase CoaBC [Alphaproteobacteria bacterium]